MIKEQTRQLDEKKVAAETKLSRDFSGVYYDEFLFLDNKETRVIIDDLSYRTTEPIAEAIELLTLSCTGWAETLKVEDLACTLATKMERLIAACNLDRTVFILPGEGVRPVIDTLPRDLLDKIENSLQILRLPTNRRVNSSTANVEGVDIGDKQSLRKITGDRKAETIIVIDDVITTGLTLGAINEFAARKQQWYACSLMILSPIQNRRRSSTSISGIDGYNSIVTAVTYQGLSGIPAVNSLSTLVSASPKGEMVRSKYISDFVEDKDTFMEAVTMIKGVTIND